MRIIHVWIFYKSLVNMYGMVTITAHAIEIGLPIIAESALATDTISSNFQFIRKSIEKNKPKILWPSTRTQQRKKRQSLIKCSWKWMNEGTILIYRHSQRNWNEMEHIFVKYAFDSNSRCEEATIQIKCDASFRNQML